MEWEAGRRLKSITQNDTVTSFKYNLDGMRTAKLVNGVELVKCVPVKRKLRYKDIRSFDCG